MNSSSTLSRFARRALCFALGSLSAACAGEDGVDCFDASGDTNADGALGAIDCIGPIGPVGGRGPAGPRGQNGSPGATGATGPAGAAGEPGPQGEIGPSGATGETGATGATGATGPTGPAGASATLTSDPSEGTEGGDDPGAPGESSAPSEPAVSTPDAITALARDVSARSEAIMAVFCTTDGDVTGYGTATKTLDGSVITAFHVIDGCSSLTFTQGSPLDPVVLGTALGPFDAVQPLAGRDLAIVGEISWTEAGLALAGLHPIWDFTAELGELTLTVGMPAFFFDAQFAPGFITSPTLENSLEYFGRTIEWSEAFVTDAATAGGASGGPVFDAEGRWVGIHVGASTDTALELSIQIPLRR